MQPKPSRREEVRIAPDEIRGNGSPTRPLRPIGTRMNLRPQTVRITISQCRIPPVNAPHERCDTIEPERILRARVGRNALRRANSAI